MRGRGKMRGEQVMLSLLSCDGCLSSLPIWAPVQYGFFAALATVVIYLQWRSKRRGRCGANGRVFAQASSQVYDRYAP